MINTYVAIDIETTGLNPKTDRIIELAAVKVENGEIIDTFETLVNPRKSLPDFIRNLTGIHGEELQNAPDIQEVIESFINFCEGYVLLGHNVIFDYSFIKRNAVNLELEFEKEGIDTLRIARKILPYLEKKSLSYLCEYYKIENKNQHRAFDDAEAAATLYKKLVLEFGNTEEGQEIFLPQKLTYEIKKEGPITKAQKKYLINLLDYHNLTLREEIKYLTKNEASRKIDSIILNYGRIL
ncbi:MAG: 3'-5' exonuclease [Clostridiales bacterium]|nr:3'-5' exonuclease [Clostridiales bacterium]